MEQIVFGGRAKPNTRAEADSEDENDRFNQDLDKLSDIDGEIQQEIDQFEESLIQFKQQLYQSIVSRVKNQEPENLHTLERFHASWVQTLGYLLGVFSGIPSQRPDIPRNTTSELQILARAIKNIKDIGYDANTLLYNVLYQYQTADPFNLTKKSEQD